MPNYRKPRRTRFATVLLWTFFWCLGSGSAFAQSALLGQSGSGLKSVAVAPDEVTDRAIQSFDAALQKQRRNAPEQARAKIEPFLDELRARFESELGYAVDELRGDGFLSAAEVTDRFSSIRHKLLAEADGGVQALSEGHRPPPQPRAFESQTAFYVQLAKYTFAERNPPLAWLWALIAIVASVIAAWLIKKVLDTIEAKLKQRNAALWAETFDSLDGPLYTLALTLGFLMATHWLWLPLIAADTLEKGLVFLLVFALAWLLWSLCAPVAAALTSLFRSTYNHQLDRHFSIIIRRILRVLVLIGVLLLLARLTAGAAGLGGLIAGLGLLGVALALILKGTLDNIVSSFTIFADEPFKVGDLLNWDGQWGNVTDIGFRSTRLKLLKGHQLSIPNSILLDRSIQNISKRPWIRRRFRLGLVYDTSPDKLREAIKTLYDIFDEYKDELADDEPPRVYFEEYGKYDLQLFVQYHFHRPEFYEALEFDSKINLDILNRFAEADIQFAYPTETHQLKSVNGEPWPIEPVGETGMDGSAKDQNGSQTASTERDRPQAQQPDSGSGSESEDEGEDAGSD